MKTYIRSWLVLALVTLLASCSSKDTVSPYFFRCKIDGNQYQINNDVGAYATVFSSNIHNVYGTEQTDPSFKNARTMYISLNGDLGVGTHAISTQTKIFSLFEDADKNVYHTNFNNTLLQKGTLTITAKSPTEIKGTFSFTAFTLTNPVKKITVTDGEFAVKYR